MRSLRPGDASVFAHKPRLERGSRDGIRKARDDLHGVRRRWDLEAVKANLFVRRVRAIPGTQLIHEREHLSSLPAPRSKCLKQAARLAHPGANVSVDLERLGHWRLDRQTAKACRVGKREENAGHDVRKLVRSFG